MFGETIAGAWGIQGESLGRRIAAMVREVAAGKLLADAVAARLSGAVNTALRNADALAHTTVTQAAVDARMPVWRANGVNAFRFHAVLDSRTTMECAMRHGLLYDLDTLAPIGHSIVLDRAPPRRYRCRSIMLPMAYGPDIPMPEDGGQSTFREYFDSLSEAEQDELFGPRRAESFRAGVITQSDLVGQHGRRATIVDMAKGLPPEGRAKVWMGVEQYKKHAAELTPAMRVKGAQYALSEAEMVVIRHYTGPARKAFNEALRGGREGIHGIGAELLNGALNKLPMYRGTVIRRVNLPDDALALHVPGNIVTYQAFTSASANRPRDTMANRERRLVIESLTGRRISTWSAFKGQEEVLFGAPRRFEVSGRKVVDRDVWIWLREIDQ